MTTCSVIKSMCSCGWRCIAHSLPVSSMKEGRCIACPLMIVNLWHIEWRSSDVTSGLQSDPEANTIN